MKLTQIRNATVRLQYGGVRFLIDPMLSPKGTIPPFHSRLRPDAWNPLNELPLPLADVIDVDAVIVTHLHPDHFDDAAAKQLPKSLPIFAQNTKDAEFLAYCGFLEVRVMDGTTVFRGVSLTKTPGQHGDWVDEEQVKRLGDVCGVVFRAEGEPCLYATGDTVWFGGVARTLSEQKPDVVLANAGGNTAYQHRLIMDAEDLLRVHKALPDAAIVATHMEAVNHWALSREELRQFAVANGFDPQLRTPKNGEIIEL